MPDNDKTRTVYDRTPRERTITQTPCLCGCGEFPTRDTAEFVPGHDARYKRDLVAAHLAGTTVVLREGETETEHTALALATARHWQGFLLAAEGKEAEKKAKAAKQKKA